METTQRDGDARTNGFNCDAFALETGEEVMVERIVRLHGSTQSESDQA